MEPNQSLAFIVDRLNDQPFQMSLTMVAFDEKSPFELLEVVNEARSATDATFVFPTSGELSDLRRSLVGFLRR